MKRLVLFLLVLTLIPLHAETGGKIVSAARQQIGVTTSYKFDVLAQFPITGHYRWK